MHRTGGAVVRVGAAATWIAVMTLPPVVHAFGRYDARNGDECREQVNANYDAIVAEMRAHGNFRGIAATEERGRAVALADCELMDRQAQQATMSQAWQRLSTALETIRAGGEIPADERHVLAADHDAIAQFPPSPYGKAYLRLYADYMRYEAVRPVPPSPASGAAHVFRCTDAGGQVEFSQEPCAAGTTGAEIDVRSPRTGGAVSWGQCRELRVRLDHRRAEHDDAVAALLASRAAGGTAGWRTLDERRIAAISEMDLLRFRAREAGCSPD